MKVTYFGNLQDSGVYFTKQLGRFVAIQLHWIKAPKLLGEAPVCIMSHKGLAAFALSHR